MKNHIYHPLWVVIGLVCIILAVRYFYVPKDFGIGERGYMYGWHRKGDVEFWKNFKVKYRGSQYCKDCHSENYEKLMKSPHVIIPCEDCHSPAIDHPENPTKLEIQKGRELCLRCHYPLPYPTSGRANIPSVDPETHNPGTECVMCHNPHNPLEGLQ
jgi:predicted CXXCH cytochrome family protein